MSTFEPFFVQFQVFVKLLTGQIPVFTAMHQIQL